MYMHSGCSIKGHMEKLASLDILVSTEIYSLSIMLFLNLQFATL